MAMGYDERRNVLSLEIVEMCFTRLALGKEVFILSFSRFRFFTFMDFSAPFHAPVEEGNSSLKTIDVSLQLYPCSAVHLFSYSGVVLEGLLLRGFALSITKIETCLNLKTNKMPMNRRLQLACISKTTLIAQSNYA